MNWLKEIVLRLRMPLNKFWARFRLLMIAVGALSFALTEVLQPLLGNVYIPEPYNNWLNHVYMFALFGAAIASFTVHSTTALNQAIQQEKLK